MIDDSMLDDLRELTLSIVGDALNLLRAGADAGTLAVALLDAAVLVAQSLRGADFFRTACEPRSVASRSVDDQSN